jgi:hypothetical protein
MEIKKVYTTSKGIFWSAEEALKKVNRVKGYGSRPGDPFEYEPVCESFVLVDYKIDGTANVFSLNPVNVS